MRRHRQGSEFCPIKMRSLCRLQCGRIGRANPSLLFVTSLFLT